MNESQIDELPSELPLPPETAAEARLLDRLADLLVTAHDVVHIARDVAALCNERALTVEARAERIYESVRALLEDLAD
jgi:hypothetical protein